MSWFGRHPNLGDFQRDAWGKALERFSSDLNFSVESWIPEGLVLLDLDGTEIGRHLGPEISQFPVWGDRRPVGMAVEGLVIPYDSEGSGSNLSPLQISWGRIQPAFDEVHFSLTADVIVTIRLSEEAATAVRARLEAHHG
ncbi:hypothetical protein [Geothrix limicola]|uniref:hypothetical protein n=1 Tax=Geothrix limicola TaxID=2927978 RepID=UPI00255623FA|nr:hypothetical protein [Geothrix limicola]